MIEGKDTGKIIQETGLISPRDNIPKKNCIRVQAINEHTFIIGLKEILPEDILWRRENPRVPSLICFDRNNSCSCIWGCVPKFVTRCVWLFNSFKSLEQILVLFNREEKNLSRKISSSAVSLGKDLKVSDFVTSVPRVKVLHVTRQFADLVNPYRIFPANYEGMRVVLSSSIPKEIDVPVFFW